MFPFMVGGRVNPTSKATESLKAEVENVAFHDENCNFETVQLCQIGSLVNVGEESVNNMARKMMSRIFIQLDSISKWNFLLSRRRLNQMASQPDWPLSSLILSGQAAVYWKHLADSTASTHRLLLWELLQSLSNWSSPEQVIRGQQNQIWWLSYLG